jgi:hypothetical protein
MPVFALLERMMVKKVNFPPGILLRIITRSAYVGEVLMIAISGTESERNTERLIIFRHAIN